MIRAISEISGEAQATFALSFGPFLLQFPQRELSRDNVPIRLGSRATDILVTLVQSAGELVSHDELTREVWGDTIVEESALRVHMSAVRKALGDCKDGMRYIVNETGRGYRFVATVVVRAAHTQPAQAPVGVPQCRLPAGLTRIVGRDDVVDGLSTLVPEHRFLTIVGPGGIGKTTVALAVAQKFVAVSNTEGCFVDFAPVSHPALAGSTVASALGVPVPSEDVAPALIAALGDRPVLLLFDNCEHLIDAIALLAERLLRGVPNLRILATSREPMRAEGEWVHRLSTLGLPPRDEPLSVSDAMTFPSVQLFVERAQALSNGFTLTDANVTAVRDISIRLDGIPLALEFAAARVDMMDVSSIAARLDDRFTLLTKGRRTALPRQQTLRAVLDWSYELLDPLSQIVLQRLSLFRSRFDMADALAVAGGDGIDELAVLNATTDLVSKSLISSETTGPETRYWLLDTTRHYGLAKLGSAPGAGSVKRRHALHCSAIFADPTSAWEGALSRDRIGRNSHHVDDLRAAFDWAFSPDGDAALGVDLLISTTNLWFHLSLPNEFFAQAQKAITALETSELRGSFQHWALMATYGLTLWHLRGPVPEMRDAFERAQAIAENLGHPTLRKRSVWGTWAWTIVFGEYAASLAAADAFCAMPDTDDATTNQQIGRRIRALSLHFLGQQAMSRDLIDAYIEADQLLGGGNQTNHAQVDGGIAAQSLLMRVLWLQGQTEAALACARACAAQAVAMDHDLSISFALGMGVIPVALWSNDIALANAYLPILRSRTNGRGLEHGASWTEGYEAALAGTGTAPDGASLMQLEVLATVGSTEALTRLLRVQREDVTTWAQPELLRLKANQIAMNDPFAARQIRERALAVADAQGAVAWRLKILNDFR